MMYEKHYKQLMLINTRKEKVWESSSQKICGACGEAVFLEGLDNHWIDNHITPFEMIEELRQDGIWMAIHTYYGEPESYMVSIRYFARGKGYKDEMRTTNDPVLEITRIYRKWRKHKEGR